MRTFNADKIYVTKEAFSELNYKLLYNYKDYQPSIEICRGCGNKCDFCLEKDYPVGSIKPPRDVIEEAEKICSIYKTQNLNFYFQASIFNPSIDWAYEFRNLYKEKEMKFKWRFETRVDSINLQSINILSEAGLKVVDLGLETASITQIKRMNKACDPVQYLKKADLLLKQLHKNNIWAKLNIMLYLAENIETIRETELWLDERKEYIKGVSVNPFILYLNGNNQKKYYKFIEEVTNKHIDFNYFNKHGYTYIDLSEQFTIEYSKKVSKEIADRYMSQKDYLDLKQFSYTKRGVEL